MFAVILRWLSVVVLSYTVHYTAAWSWKEHQIKARNNHQSHTRNNHELPAMTNHKDGFHITDGPRDKKVSHTAIVSFICRVSGDNPNIIWQKNGRKIKKTKQSRFDIYPMVGGSVLRIEPVKSQDNGRYRCYAENDQGDIDRAEADLKVYDKFMTPYGYPEIVYVRSAVRVDLGSNILISCVVMGDPVPAIRWLKDAIPVNFSNPRVQQYLTGDLQITRSEHSDEGTYECVAENSLGMAYSEGINLYVTEQAPVFYVTPRPMIEVSAGEAVTLLCAANGNHVPHVIWTKNAHQPHDIAAAPLGKNILYLDSIHQSATYTCHAINNVDHISISTIIHVID